MNYDNTGSGDSQDENADALLKQLGKRGVVVSSGTAKKKGVLSTIEIKDHVSRYTKNTKNTGVLSANTTNVVKTSDDKPINQAVAALVISGAAFIIAFRKKVK